MQPYIYLPSDAQIPTPRALLLPLLHSGAIGALMNRVRQPRTLIVLGLNAEMGTAAGADELVEVPYRYS